MTQNIQEVTTQGLQRQKKKPVYLSKCGVCGSKKLRFIKKQEACGLLSNLGIKTLLSKIPILGVILF